MSVLSVHLNSQHGFSKISQPSIKLLKGLGVKGDCHLGKTTQHLWRLKNHATEPNLRQVHLIQSELFDEPDFHGDDGVRIQPGEMGENITTTGIDLLSLGNGTKLHFVDKNHTQTEFDSRYSRILSGVSVFSLMCLALNLLIGAVAMSMRNSFSWYGIALMMGIIGCLNVVALVYTTYTKLYPGEHPIITVTGVRHPCKKVEKFRSGLQEKCVVRGGEKNSIIKRKAGIMAVVTRAGIVKPGMTIVVETTSRFEELPVLP